MFKRFRDSITGMFTSKADAEARPDQTEAQTVSKISVAKFILRSALAKERSEPDLHQSNLILHAAIDRVIKL